MRVVALDPPGGIVLSDFYIYGNHAGHFHLFSLVGVDGNAEGSAVTGGLLSDTDDTRALSIHEAYRAKDLAMISQNLIIKSTQTADHGKTCLRMYVTPIEWSLTILRLRCAPLAVDWVPSMRCKKSI